MRDTVPGTKHDSAKPRWSLLPWRALGAVVDVLTFGARKYAPDNWLHVPDARRRYADALLRHVTASLAGERIDPDSGLSHLAHAACNVLFLLHFELEEVSMRANPFVESPTQLKFPFASDSPSPSPSPSSLLFSSSSLPSPAPTDPRGTPPAPGP